MTQRTHRLRIAARVLHDSRDPWIRVNAAHRHHFASLVRRKREMDREKQQWLRVLKMIEAEKAAHPRG